MSKVKATLRVLAIVTSTLSMASHVQALAKLGLIPVLEGLITYYRTIAWSLFGLPVSLLGLRPPQALLDIWALSFVGAGAYVQTEGIEKSRALRSFELDSLPRAWRVGLLIVLGFSGLGIAIVLGAIHPFTYVDDFHEEPLDLMKGAATNILWVCAGLFVFFAFNAYAPSLAIH
jgi:hypothetical protein